MKDNSPEIFTPGSIIGIMGGGQLGRMTALAAANLGYRCHIYTDQINTPAAQVSEQVTVASYEDIEALTQFAETVDLITYEFENIPLSTANLLSQLKVLRPSPSVLAISQHRAYEKEFAVQNGVKVAPYKVIKEISDLEPAAKMLGTPCVLKTCRFGYDGKGQIIINSLEEIESAWNKLCGTDLVLEKFIKFEKEISVIVARDVNHQTKVYQPVENKHVNHILDTTIVPANITEKTTNLATTMSLVLANALNLVGLLAIEMFVMEDGSVVMNEIAPRPHNSGHWTQDGSETSQFEQFVRAITGQPLGLTGMIRPITMKNLIGDAVDQAPIFFKDPNAKIHLYGKTEVRPGRKMGHINIITKP